MVCVTVGPKQPLLRATGARPTAEQLPSAGAQLLGAYKAVKGCPPAALRLTTSMFMHASFAAEARAQAEGNWVSTRHANALETLPRLFAAAARNNSPAPPLRCDL